MPYRCLLLLLVLCSLVLQAESCWYPGPRGLLGGADDGDAKEDPEGRCVAVPDGGVPGLGFIPRHDGLFIDGPLWVTNSASPKGLVALDADELPPASYVPSRDIAIPADSDGDGEADEATLIVERLRIVSLSFGLITAWTYDEVLFFNPSDTDTDDGGLARYAVSVPAAFGNDDYPRLPAPDADPVPLTAVSTKACIRAAGMDFSNGTSLAIAEADRCVAGDDESYYSSRTTGATVINDRLFVSINNLHSNAVPAEPIYRPGTVLVYKFSDGGVSPVDPADPDPLLAGPSIIFTEGYNPSDVISYTTPGGRPFVLVVVNGAVGMSGDDFRPVSGAAASIEVIDARTLELVGTYPLGNAALFGSSALDSENGVLVVGSAIDRKLFSVDLAPLAESDFRTTGPPEVFSTDATDSLVISLDPPVDTGTCVGLISGMAISDDQSEIYAVDTCSGTLTVVDAADDGTLTQGRQIELTYPINEPDPDPAAETETVVLKRPSSIVVRPGEPGQSYAGSDVFFHAAEPEGQVCAQNVQAN